MAHDRRKTEPGQYKCKSCGQTFKTAEELKDHELKLHSSDIQPEDQPESEGSTAGQSRIKR
jgi:hypothetical protein